MTDRGDSNSIICFSGVAAILVVLGVTMALTLAWAGDDTPRREAVFFAAAVAAGGALAGWFVTCLSRRFGPGIAAAGGMAATVVRLGPMLMGLGWVSAVDADLRAAGAGELLVLFYLPLLAVDIGLVLLTGARSGRNRGANRAI